MPQLHLYLLGPPRLTQDAQTVTIDARKTMALLAYLAVTDSRQSRETLLALLWPELEQRRAQNVLRRNLSVLNKTLDGRWLDVNRDTIGLDNESDSWVDVSEFRRLSQRVHNHDHPAAQPCEDCLQELSVAVELYRADFLSGFGVRSSPNFDNWQLLEAKRLRRELAVVLERLVQGHSSRRQFELAIRYAQHGLTLDPLQEPLHRRLMQLYADKGDRSSALRQYQACVRLLDAELGVPPESETVALYNRLRQEAGHFGRKQDSGDQLSADVRLAKSDPEPPLVNWPTASDQPPLPTGPTPPCPYRGLFAFQESDAPYFFGREAVTRQLLAMVQANALVAVVGSSGSGKSSVVFAGLLAQLRTQEQWIIATFRPGNDPFQSLAVSLMLCLEPDPSEVVWLVEARKLAESLRSGELLLVDVIGRILQKNKRKKARILIVADQFEELYTLCPDADARRDFLDTLLDIIELQPFQRDRTFTLLLTLRADFLEQLLTYRPIADAIQDATMMLGPMDREELARAIEEPATQQAVTFEPGLVERILSDVGEEPGNLPLLEFSLTTLWARQQARQLTHSSYEAIGRVSGALTRHADQTFDTLHASEQAAVQRMLFRLIRLGEGTDDTRRVARRNEFDKADWNLLQRLADTRLVVTGRDATGAETVELVHEALIRSWERLQGWLNSDRSFRLWQERLRAAVLQWQATGEAEGALLRGIPLNEAEGWLAERPENLSHTERRFVQTSLALRAHQEAEREQQRRAREQLTQRVTVGAISGLIVAMVLASIAVAQWRLASRQRRAAIAARAEVEAERDQAQLALSRQLSALATTYLAEQLDLALLLAVEATQIADTGEARRVLRQGLTSNARLAFYLWGHSDRVNSVAYSPDGRTVASASNDDTIILWDVTSGESIGSPLAGHTDNILSIAFSPNGQLLASGSLDKTIMLWDAASGQLLQQPLVGHAAGVGSVAFSPDNHLLATSGAEAIVLWDLTSNPPMSTTLTGHRDVVRSVAFSPDGLTLASGSDDGQLILWDVASRIPIEAQLQGHEALIRSVAFSPDGHTLASASEDGKIILWDLDTMPIGIQLLEGHNGSVRGIAFSPRIPANGEAFTLASASTDGTVRLWNSQTGKSLMPPLIGHTDWVRSVAFSPDGHTLASASHDHAVILWKLGADVPDIAASAILNGHDGNIRTVAFSPDGRTLASGGDDNAITLWDRASGTPKLPPLAGHSGSIRTLAFSPDGQLIASGSNDGTIILWDVASGARKGAPLIGHAGGVQSVAFNANGEILAAGDDEGQITLWNVAQGRTRGRPLNGHSGSVQEVAFSPDGQILASAGDDTNIRLWNMTSAPRLRATLIGHNDVVFSLAFSPDGQTLASGGWDRAVILWDVATEQTLAPPMMGHDESVQGVAWSPDGQLLASSGWDEKIILWSVISGSPIPIEPSLVGHTGSVRGIAFSSDGYILASGSDDKTIMLWDVSLGTWQARACRRANRNLSQDEWQRFFGIQSYRRTCPDLPMPEGQK